MTGLLCVVFLLAPIDEQLKRADALAAAAKAAARGEARKQAVEKALAAYDAVIALRPKDRKMVPRVRRRRAALLKGEKRIAEALAEHDQILAGRARRKDKARALYDGAMLLDKPEAAARRLRRVLEEYADITSAVAKASLARGSAMERLDRPADAERAYRHVIDRCRDEAKAIVEAYDRLALLCIARKQPKKARAWLKACVKRYEKRAARGDRYGAFLCRLLGDMRAPRRLTEALAEGGE